MRARARGFPTVFCFLFFLYIRSKIQRHLHARAATGHEARRSAKQTRAVGTNRVGVSVCCHHMKGVGGVSSGGGGGATPPRRVRGRGRTWPCQTPHALVRASRATRVQHVAVSEPARFGLRLLHHAQLPVRLDLVEIPVNVGTRHAQLCVSRGQGPSSLASQHVCPRWALGMGVHTHGDATESKPTPFGRDFTARDTHTRLISASLALARSSTVGVAWWRVM